VGTVRIAQLSEAAIRVVTESGMARTRSCSAARVRGFARALMAAFAGRRPRDVDERLSQDAGVGILAGAGGIALTLNADAGQTSVFGAGLRTVNGGGISIQAQGSLTSRRAHGVQTDGSAVSIEVGEHLELGHAVR
jgi:hypothetical protein